MNNMTIVAEIPEVSELLTVEDLIEVRFVKDEYKTDRQVLGTKTCCICNMRIWKIDNLDRVTMNHLIFKVIDPRAYVFGTPDYLKTSNVLLECHFTCKNEFINQLNNGTFIQR